MKRALSLHAKTSANCLRCHAIAHTCLEHRYREALARIKDLEAEVRRLKPKPDKPPPARRSAGVALG